MAKLSLALSTGLLLVFFIVISEGAAVPKICEKASKTFSGKCDNKKCDKQCISWEKATHGSCHKREGKDACFCYYDCAKGSGGKPAPPGAGLTPPPGADGGPPPPPPSADGGSPPPPADGGSPPPPADGGSPPPSAH